MGSYDDGRSKASNYTSPTEAQRADSGFMSGYNAQKQSDFAQQQLTTSLINNHTTTPSYHNEPSSPPVPITLTSTIKNFAITGLVFSIIYVFIMNSASPAMYIKWAIIGLAGGAFTGVALWLVIKILELALWLIGWGIKIGLELGLIYFVAKYVLY